MYHLPVLLEESINALNINPEGIYIDLTFGGGGHSKLILKKLTKGKLIAFDKDKDAEKNILKNGNFIFINGNFMYLKNYLLYYGIKKVDGILGDLGVSSHHFNEKKRGFSFRFDGTLDMRMNTNSNLKAKDILNNYTENNLYKIFKNYGEIKNCKKLINLITTYRRDNEFNKIFDFLEAIKIAIPKNKENKYLAKVFQALRIEVNQEIKVLKKFLLQTPKILKKNGRLVIISYHSLEDRIVKKFFKSGNFDGKIEKDFFGNIINDLKIINRKVIIPSEKELKNNKRSRSAKLRIAEKN
ncbi:MAG: 16S rRNA (cytosine(1402)-N(4))-methyltransferase [Bacteroidetes bacterium 4572_128]|nr:MAG: 16S rRNA (cytosine(1402)-N(4))-methyltransferase [Bacteroidetes bacterium 4572_128]